MMKKVLLAGAVSAMALASTVEAKVEHSPYIGLGLGAVGFRNTINIYETSTSHNPNSNKQAAAIGAILGYGCNVDSFHVAAELDYYYNSGSRAKSDVNSSTGYATGVASNGAFGAALRLGYWLSQNHLLYVRGGIEVRRFDFNLDSGSSSSPSVSSHDTRLAFTPGLGLEMKLNDNLSLNLEARTAFYSSKERSNTNSSGTTTRGKYRPQIDSALLSVRYKIGPLFS